MSDDSAKTIKATFPTREAADLAVEHLTQEHGIDRADVFIGAAGGANTSGTRPSGGDAPSTRSDHSRGDAQLDGEVEVSVDVTDQKLAAARRVFENGGGHNISAA
ncbi:hypothetical protein ABID21_003552 [Pseudorhizobium tarimense]|uniref:Uncharacterized protein n=1 Tax=Pseudorhizobium tarimense TaxID=1079109 RepID=A0ABV2HA55_9HYPH|nr:hypothetical protein [Pseudorhizobium tarimense]MCJ8520568.1 hypothetical protein [Pseudorhizobium tarimense]